MIRFNYSSSGEETNALFVDRVVSASQALFSLTSSYDNSKWELTGSIVSNKTQGGEGWILVQSSKDLAPTASGQWFADVSPWIDVTKPAIWNQAALIWEENNTPVVSIDYIWNIFQTLITGQRDGGFIDTERVMVSGSNTPIITKYTSNNENATFNTYQD